MRITIFPLMIGIMLTICIFLNGCVSSSDPYQDWYWLTIVRSKENSGYYIIEPIEIDGVIYESIDADGYLSQYFKEGDQAWFKCLSKSTTTRTPFLDSCHFQSFNKYATYEKQLQKKEDIENSSDSGTENKRGHT